MNNINSDRREKRRLELIFLLGGLFYLGVASLSLGCCLGSGDKINALGISNKQRTALTKRRNELENSTIALGLPGTVMVVWGGITALLSYRRPRDPENAPPESYIPDYQI